jgi:hypothetical protein
MENIIQIKEKTANLLNNNNDNKYKDGIKINLYKNNIDNNLNDNNINNINKIYKKRFPNLNEYFNHDNNNNDNEIYKNVYPINEQYLLNNIKYNPKMNQLNYLNNNYNMPNQKYPNIITNNNNYYYSILDDFPIVMPIYYDNIPSSINMIPGNKLYHTNTSPNNFNNSMNNNNILRNNFFIDNEFYNHNPNLNLLNFSSMKENNFYESNYINNYYNKELLYKRNPFMDYNLDYSIYRNRFINNKYLSQNRINLIKPTFIFSPFKKRARSHERPFNLINKYYNDNFILEEDNEERNK